MGFQQSIVKAENGKNEELITFAVNNQKWFRDKDFSFYGVVRVSKDVDLDGIEFEKDELCIVVGGERYPQRLSSDEGLSELDSVKYVYPIDNISHDLFSEKDTGDLLDEYFPMIKDGSFYEKYQKENN